MKQGGCIAAYGATHWSSSVWTVSAITFGWFSYSLRYRKHISQQEFYISLFKTSFLNTMARSCLKGSHWEASSAHTVLVHGLLRTSPLGLLPSPQCSTESRMVWRVWYFKDSGSVSHLVTHFKGDLGQNASSSFPFWDNNSKIKSWCHKIFNILSEYPKHGSVGVTSKEAKKWSESWSLSALETGWESWECSVWRKEGSRKTLEPLPVSKGTPGGLERDFGQVIYHWPRGTAQWVMTDDILTVSGAATGVCTDVYT